MRAGFFLTTCAVRAKLENLAWADSPSSMWYNFRPLLQRLDEVLGKFPGLNQRSTTQIHAHHPGLTKIIQITSNLVYIDLISFNILFLESTTAFE